MYILVIVLIMIASLLIILSVLAQSPKGGMAANFGASNQVMGVRQTSDFLEKFTWGLALSIVVLSLAATMLMPKERIEASRRGSLEDQIQRSVEGGQTFPLPMPFDTESVAPEAGSAIPEAEGVPAAQE